jgi:tetratricopeptide (TPR) repeat protein
VICSNCRRESNTASRVCPYCGQYMAQEALPLIKGDAVPVYDDSDYWAPERRPGVKKKARQQPRRRKRRIRRSKKGQVRVRRHMVNWAMVGLFALIAVILLAIGSYIYLMVTPNGQLIMARMGREASADAYWQLGTELLDQGYVARSITTYEHALSLEPEREDLVDKLMLLAEAYEAAGQPQRAEQVYTRIYTTLQPDKPLGYRHVIRLMLQQERLNEATALMIKAFEATGDDSFMSQRSTLVPLPPTATVPGGRQLIKQDVSFVSPQGYDIYYTTGDAPLPEQGTLYTGPITLGEGTHSFRAVCVSSALISDEMSVKYIVTLPQPPAPNCNLAPGEYKGARSVRLRDMETDKKDKMKENTLYFTIDGTQPTTDSPRYVGEPIRLPAGRKVVLRAIAVNGYGKVSNEFRREFTINNGPIIKYFNGKDDFAGIPLMKTVSDKFYEIHGQPQLVTEITDDAVAGVSISARYQWGEARFVMLDIGNTLYHIDTTDPTMKGPRGAKVGMDMADVTALFRDMGQPPNDRGDRGIYYDIKDGYANYTASADDPTTGTLRYVASVFDETASTRLLTFEVKAGKVERIIMRYVDRKISIVF